MTLKDLYQRPGFLLRRTHQISAAVFENACASVGLTPAQYGVLSVLAIEPGLDQTRLARALAFDKVTVMRVCKGLEERGLIERRMSEHSRRQMAVVLTPAGTKLLQQARGPAEQAYQRLLSPLTLVQRQQLIVILEALTQGLADDARAPFVPLLPPASDDAVVPVSVPKVRANRTNTGRSKTGVQARPSVRISLARFLLIHTAQEERSRGSDRVRAVSGPRVCRPHRRLHGGTKARENDHVIASSCTSFQPMEPLMKTSAPTLSSRRNHFFKPALGLALSLAAFSSFAQAPAQMKIATVVWIGYGPFYVAEALDLYKKYNLKVSLQVFNDP
eukprot:gene17018-35266_t